MRALRRYFKGELAERSNAAVLKTVSPQGLGGSNPSLSANLGVEAHDDPRVYLIQLSPGPDGWSLTCAMGRHPYWLD